MATTVRSYQQNKYVIVETNIKGRFITFHFPFDKNNEFSYVENNQTHNFKLEYNQVSKVKNLLNTETKEILPTNIKIKNFIDIFYG